MAFSPRETAWIIVGNRRFPDWESVTVHWGEGEADTWYKLSVSEGAPLKKDWAEIRIIPGDHCTVFLAGQLAITGQVTKRQVAYNATSHGIELEGKGMSGMLDSAAANTPTMEYKDKGIEHILSDQVKKLGIKFKPIGTLPDKPFPRVNIMPGQSIWELADYLARMRGVTLGHDAEGNLTGRVEGNEETPEGALIEGRNILEANLVMTSDGNNRVNLDGQQPGTDEKHGPAANQSKAAGDTGVSKALGTQATYGPNYIPAEAPADKQDLTYRGQSEANKQELEDANGKIVVQGWLRNGALWKPGTKVHVRSPMLILDEPMLITGVTFTQDNKSGSRTAIELKRTDIPIKKADLTPGAKD